MAPFVALGLTKVPQRVKYVLKYDSLSTMNLHGVVALDDLEHEQEKYL